MEQTWKSSTGATLYAPIPAHVAPFVEIMGADIAVRFLLKYGGAALYIARGGDKSGRQKLVATIGEEAADRLYEMSGSRIDRCPVSAVFISRHLKGQGVSIQEIARTLHRTDKTIREYLMAGGGFPMARVRRGTAK